MESVQLNVRLKTEMAAELESIALREGLTKSALVRMATLRMLRSLREQGAKISSEATAESEVAA
jgi:hypothetical protein